MKKTIVLTALTIVAVVGFLLQYEPKALAQVAGFFSTLMVSSTATFNGATTLNAGGGLAGSYSGNPTFTGTLTESGALNVSGTTTLAGGHFNGSYDGNPSFSGTISATGGFIGNSSTATALATTPTNCGTRGTSYGIAANGNALCPSSTYADEYWAASVCSFSTDNNGTSCVASEALPVAFADTSYFIFCTPTHSNGSLGSVMIVPSSKTTSGFQLTLTENWGNSAGAGNSWSSMDCHAHHN